MWVGTACHHAASVLFISNPRQAWSKQGWRATLAPDWTNKGLISSNWNSPTGSVDVKIGRTRQERKEKFVTYQNVARNVLFWVNSSRSRSDSHLPVDLTVLDSFTSEETDWPLPEIGVECAS
jgi:hypothetical protein